MHNNIRSIHRYSSLRYSQIIIHCRLSGRAFQMYICMYIYIYIENILYSRPLYIHHEKVLNDLGFFNMEKA